MADSNIKLETVTTAEAAFVVGMPQRQVNKEIDAGPIQARKVRGRRMLGQADLVYLKVVKELAGKLKPEARAALYGEVKRTHANADRAAATAATYGQDIEVHSAAVRAGLERLRQARALIDAKAKNWPLIRGTSIEAHRIAALLDGGATIEMVLEDYPSLKRSQVEAARDFAAAHPKPGRRFPSLSFTRAFDGAGLDDLADILDAMVAKRRRSAR